MQKDCESLPPEWQLLPFPSCIREDLESMSKEKLKEKLVSMKKNKQIVSDALKKDMNTYHNLIYHLIKAKRQRSQLEQERRCAYWGGLNEGYLALDSFLDPRLHITYNRISKKIEDIEMKYDYLYDKLSEALPDETLPGLPGRGKQLVTMLKKLKEEIDSLRSTHNKDEVMRDMTKTRHAIVRCKELDIQLVELQREKQIQGGSLWKDCDYVRYIDLASRVYLVEQKLKELTDEEETIEDLIEVDDTENLNEYLHEDENGAKEDTEVSV